MEVLVDGHRIPISHPLKMLFPDDGITKGQLVDYYRRIADRMLPHVRARPLHMQRFPDGIGRIEIQQKRIPDSYPAWISRVVVRRRGGETLTHAVIDNTATLVYIANQNCITPHVWPSRLDRIDFPDRLIFDLDPSDDNFDLVRATARAVRDLLERLGLTAFVKTTGSRGLHVVTPLDAQSDFGDVQEFARQVALVLVTMDPDRLTVEFQKAKRKGRLFIDTARNGYAQTAVAPYAVRARPGAPIAMPIPWKEVDSPSLQPDSYTMRNVFRRITRRRDPWTDMDRVAGSLRAARDRLRA
jgi:bifunctional non-homologous end joining protein LigD